MLSSFRKRRVQVFDQHAENALPFRFCLVCSEGTSVSERLDDPKGGGEPGPHAFSVKVPVRVGFSLCLVLVLCEQKS